MHPLPSTPLRFLLHKFIKGKKKKKKLLLECKKCLATWRYCWGLGTTALEKKYRITRIKSFPMLKLFLYLQKSSREETVSPAACWNCPFIYCFCLSLTCSLLSTPTARLWAAAPSPHQNAKSSRIVRGLQVSWNLLNKLCSTYWSASLSKKPPEKQGTAFKAITTISKHKKVCKIVTAHGQQKKLL